MKDIDLIDHSEVKGPEIYIIDKPNGSPKRENITEAAAHTVRRMSLVAMDHFLKKPLN